RSLFLPLCNTVLYLFLAYLGSLPCSPRKSYVLYRRDIVPLSINRDLAVFNLFMRTKGIPCRQTVVLSMRTRLVGNSLKHLGMLLLRNHRARLFMQTGFIMTPLPKSRH